MRMTVEIDKRMLRDVQRKLGSFSKKAPNAISNALNRAMSNINSNVKKEVRAKYNIKAGDVQDTLKKIRASRGSLAAGVHSKGGVIGLDKFKVSPKTVNPRRKTPIRVGVKKGGMKSAGGAFVADISGAKVFKRRGKRRLPIQRLFGPSVPQMLDNKEIRARIEQQGQETFQKRLDHEINRILGRV